MLLSVLCLSVGCGQPGPASPQADGQADQTVADAPSDIASFIEAEVRQRLPLLSVEPSEEQLAAITPFAKYYASFVERIESPDAAQSFRSDFSSRLDGCLAQPGCTLDRLWVQAQLGTAEATRASYAKSTEELKPGYSVAISASFSLQGYLVHRLANDNIRIAMSRFLSDLMDEVSFREGNLSPAVRSALVEQHPEVVQALRKLMWTENGLGSQMVGTARYNHAAAVQAAEAELLEAVMQAGNKIRAAASIPGAYPSSYSPLTTGRIREIADRHAISSTGSALKFYGKLMYGLSAVVLAGTVWELVKISEEHYVWVPEQTSELEVQSDGSVTRKPQQRQSALDRR